MRKILAAIIAEFIRDPQKRRNFREKYSRSPLNRKLDEINAKLDWLGAFGCATTDIRNIPAARGNLHLTQAAATNALALFDMVCREHGLKYFLGAGNLLGVSLLDGRPLPWDDDIDVYMMRQDYEKALKILPEVFKNSGIRLAYQGYLLKFCGYKDFPFCLDICPFDQYFERADSDAEKAAVLSRLKKFCRNITSKTWFNLLNRKKGWEYADGNFSIPEKLAKRYESEKQRWAVEIMRGKKTAPDGLLVRGFERGATMFQYMFDYDWVFPLKRTSYNGVETYIPNDMESCLRAEYGDYHMLTPRVPIQHSHSSRLKLSPAALASAREFISMDMKKFYKGLKK